MSVVCVTLFNGRCEHLLTLNKELEIDHSPTGKPMSFAVLSTEDG